MIGDLTMQYLFSFDIHELTRPSSPPTVESQQFQLIIFTVFVFMFYYCGHTQHKKKSTPKKLDLFFVTACSLTFNNVDFPIIFIAPPLLPEQQKPIPRQ